MVYISLLLLISYIIYYLIKYNLPHSLSATYYNTNWIFSLIICICSGLMFQKMMEVTPENLLFLVFLTITSIFFVAFAPDFKSDSLTDKVHTEFACLSFGLSLIWIIILEPIHLLWWIIVLIYLIYYIGYKKVKVKNLLENTNFKFWIELIMLITIYSKLLL